MRRERREGAEDFTLGLEGLPLEDTWLHTLEDEPWKEELNGLGLGESECVTIRTGMYEAAFDLREALEDGGEVALGLSLGLRTCDVKAVVFFGTSELIPGFLSAALGLDK